MRVYLVQHGKSKSKEEDPERPLSDEGADETGSVANAMKRKLSVSRIYHSEKLRAKQTAAILSKHLGAPAEQKEGLKPLDSTDAAVAMLEDGVMLVGHLPYMSKLASRLLAGDEENEIVKFTYSGILCLEEEDGQWRLLWYVLP